jgi:hypothetical protein
MLMTLRVAYQIFIQENPTMRVGKSKFCSIKPKWIKTTTPHDVSNLHCISDLARLLIVFSTST